MLGSCICLLRRGSVKKKKKKKQRRSETSLHVFVFARARKKPLQKREVPVWKNIPLQRRYYTRQFVFATCNATHSRDKQRNKWHVLTPPFPSPPQSQHVVSHGKRPSLIERKADQSSPFCNVARYISAAALIIFSTTCNIMLTRALRCVQHLSVGSLTR